MMVLWGHNPIVSQGGGPEGEGKRRSDREGKLETNSSKGANVDAINFCCYPTGQASIDTPLRAETGSLPNGLLFFQQGKYAAVYICNLSPPHSSPASQNLQSIVLPTLPPQGAEHSGGVAAHCEEQRGWMVWHLPLTNSVTWANIDPHWTSVSYRVRGV